MLDDKASAAELVAKLVAKADKTELSGYLPLSGGNLKGAITGTGSASGIQIYAGANNFDGATLQMFTRNHGTYAGQFYLRASTKSSSGDTTSGVKNCDLIGKPDGTLMWAGGTIVPVVASSISATKGYIKFANKLLIQWGYVTVSGSVAAKTLTFPTAFANTTYTFIRTSGGITTADANQIRAYTGEAGSRTTTSIQLYAGGNATSYSWIAIGTCS